VKPEPIFFVPGRPAPQGSMRAVRRGKHAKLISDNARTMPWRETIAQVARANGWGAELLDGALAVSLVFVFARKDSDWGKRGLKPSSTAWPERGYDVDKLSRAALDGLTNVIWKNDARVCSLHATKAWGSPEGMIVQVRPLVEAVGTVDVAFNPSVTSHLPVILQAVRQHLEDYGCAFDGAFARAKKWTPTMGEAFGGAA
jgi:crossover junction endodeoxyribonuclease RusA